MKNLLAASNLKKYIVDLIKSNLNNKLEGYCYYDVCKEDELTTNSNGIDIIAHQLELKFENNNPVFISWATIDGWFQYTLCVSKTSFCNGVEAFSKKDRNWTDIVGKRLRRFEVYGYKKNVITSTETATGSTTQETYYNEPHLLILHFDNERLLGLANFYLEKDFVPKYPMGDDMWIIFDRNCIDSCIKKLSLELLNL